MRIASGACALFLSFFSGAAAHATVVIDINLSTQTMHVRGAGGSYDWRVSTARSGYSTPRGHYRPIGLQRMHYSHKYHMSPMPYSIFFRGGYAIHGTYSTAQLGSPVSHGCVRLAPGNAARLYSMVQSEGGSISITGAPPRGTLRKGAQAEPCVGLCALPPSQRRQLCLRRRARPAAWGVRLCAVSPCAGRGQGLADHQPGVSPAAGVGLALLSVAPDREEL